MSLPDVAVRVYQEKFQQWMLRGAARTDEVLALYKREGPPIVIAQMRALIPYGKTGFLRESVTSKETPKGFTVWPSAPYALFVDQGTEPHTIFVSPTKKALRWFGAWGQPIFARYVDHPGFKGRHFIDWTVRAVALKIDKLIKDIWRCVHGYV